ncbi:MAG: tRNA-binding protein [Rhodospirillales bacterium]|nr:tRNA-binding protein [Rhodospirillales bacterium]
MTASHDDFAKLDIRVGTIIRIEPFPEAKRPSLKLWIDFGPEIGTKRSSARIADAYEANAIVGRQVAAVVNFPPRQIGPFMSECLVLGFPDSTDRVALIGPDRAVPNGGRLF